MKTLFGQIAVWFFVAFLAVAGAGLVSVGVILSGRQAALPMEMLQQMQFEDARAAWRAGGREALRTELDRQKRITGYESELVDDRGVDQVSGADRSGLLDQARESTRAQMWRRGLLVYGRSDAERRYWLLTRVPRPRVLAPLFDWRFLWLLPLGGVLCWVLAWRLSLPVRRLERAVERFGAGDLTARAAIEGADEFQKLGLAFNTMAARMQSLVEAQRRLLADVSHELRSPLTRLNLAVELARKAPEASLDRIEREAARLNELVGEVLDLSRAEANPARERVELHGLAARLVEDARVEAEPRAVRMELRAEECAVTGDPELLRRAVENVLRNAVRFAPEGSAVEIAVSAQGVVRIRDHGPGVPEAELGRLFEPFYRVERDRDRASGGAGLGLAIARRAVELHGGTIAAENAGPGLAVTLRIPAG